MVYVSLFNHAWFDRVRGHKRQPLFWGRNVKTLEFLPERRYPSVLGQRDRERERERVCSSVKENCSVY